MINLRKNGKKTCGLCYNMLIKIPGLSTESTLCKLFFYLLFIDVLAIINRYIYVLQESIAHVLYGIYAVLSVVWSYIYNIVWEFCLIFD